MTEDFALDAVEEREGGNRDMDWGTVNDMQEIVRRQRRRLI
jgi:hypothetical protein